MRHQNSVFHQLTKQVPWAAFDAAVSRHGSDRRVRRLRTRDQFLALLYGQLSGAVRQSGRSHASSRAAIPLTSRGAAKSALSRRKRQLRSRCHG